MKNIWVLYVILVLCLQSIPASATILWVGGEDIDFPTGGQVCIDTSAAYFRAGYARGAVYMCNTNAAAMSNPFPGGSVTSAWLSAQVYNNNCNNSYVLWGLAKSGSTGYLALGVGNNQSNELALWDSSNGVSWNKLAQEPGASLLMNSITKVDMQVISYGAAGTVNVYVRGGSTPVISYTGNIAPGAATNLDSVTLLGGGQNCGQPNSVSEVIVSTTDTRNLSLATLSPSAAGNTDTWASGNYSTINPTSVNPTVFASDNTSGDTLECKVNALPTGSFTIPMVKVVASGSSGSGGLASISVGVLTNGTVNAPAAVGQTGSWTSNETYYSTNPVTTSNWATGDIGGLQINLQSAP